MRDHVRSLVSLLLLHAVLSGQQQALPADRSVGGNTITVDDLKTWLTKLASKEFAGRGTGQPGFQKAADYVRSHFEKLGLKPGGDDGKYFQAVPWTQLAPDPQRWKFAITGRGIHQIDIADVRGTLAATIEGKGKGFVAIVSDLDDPPFDEVELADSIVFALITDKTARGGRARRRGLTMLQRLARQTGAAAVVLVDDVTYTASTALAGPSYPGTSRAAAGRARRGVENTLVITRKRFDAIVTALGRKPDEIADSDGTIKLADKVEIQVIAKKTQAPAYNVVGVLPGSDPKRKAEYVVIGCHLDHLGTRGGRIYPGADDDGSGSAGLMAIARAFARNGRAPARSVMFVAFCGEEMGLIGSGYFAKHPPIALSRIVAELQIDMIGRNEETRRERAENNTNSLHLIGTRKLSIDLHKICERLNEERAGFDLEYDQESVFYRSDHWMFAQRGVPIAFFFTGFHPDYHRPSDTVEKINFAKLRRVCRYVYDIGFELADADGRPLLDAGSWRGLRGKIGAEPAAPVRQDAKK